MKNVSLIFVLINIFFVTYGVGQASKDIVFEKVIDISEHHSSPISMGLQSNGDLLIAGSDTDFNKSYYGYYSRQQAFWKFTSEGNLIKEFGEEGMVADFIGKKDNTLGRTLLLPDDGWINTGMYGEEDYHGVFLSKRKKDGTIDTTFGDQGFCKIDFEKEMSWHASIGGIKILPDSSFIICGKTSIRASMNKEMGIFIAKILPNGKLDPSFGKAGLRQHVLENEVIFSMSLAIAENGDISFVGTKAPNAYSLHKLYIMKFSSDGAIKEEFGENGIFSFECEDTAFYLTKVTFSEDNQMVLFGRIAKAGGYSRICILDIPLNAPFNSQLLDNPVKLYNFGEGKYPTLHDVLLLEDGGVLFFGQNAYDKKRESFFALLHPDKTVNTEFGDNGYLTHQAGGFKLSNVSTGCLLNQKEAFFGGSIYEGGDWDLFVLKLALP